ncbi:uncharacterized protein LOC144509961 [Mustelus asterias]
MENLQKDQLYLTNGNGISDSDLEAVVNELFQAKMINKIEFEKYRNHRNVLISRVGCFLDNIKMKGPTVVEYFYQAFETINKPACDQLPSRQQRFKMDHDGLPPTADTISAFPTAYEIYVKNLSMDFVYLSNDGGINDVTLKLLVEDLSSHQVFNPAERDKHLNRNEELFRRVTDFLQDLTMKGRRPCYLFYQAFERHCPDLYTSLPSSIRMAMKP